jgi:hypothetical protein
MEGPVNLDYSRLPISSGPSSLPDNYQTIKIDFENLKALTISLLSQQQKLELHEKAKMITYRIDVLKEREPEPLIKRILKDLKGEPEVFKNEITYRNNVLKEREITKRNLKDLKEEAEAFKNEIGKAAELPDYDDFPTYESIQKPLDL